MPQILGDERQFSFEQMCGYLQNTGNNDIYLSYAKVIAILLLNLSKPHDKYWKNKNNINIFFIFGITFKKTGKNKVFCSNFALAYLL